MGSAIARLRAAGPYRLVIHLSIAALAALAAIATLSGMVALLGGGWQGWTFGLLFGTAVQVLIVVALQIVTGQSGLRALALQEARALAGDLRLESFREQVRDRLAAAATGFVDPETGERFSCPDSGLESKLKALAGARLPALPQAPAQLFEATHAASVQRGLHLVTGAARFDRERDVLPLALGIAIDVLLLFLTLARRALEAAPGSFEGLKARLDPARLLPAGHAAAWLKVVRGDDDDNLGALLDTWGVQDGRWFYLAAPIGGDGCRVLEARRLAAVLRALGMVRRVCRRRPAQMPKWWRAPRAGMLAGIEELRLYRLSQPLTDALVLEQIREALAEADAGSATDDPEQRKRGAIVPLRRRADDDSPSRNHPSPLRDDAFIDA